MEKQTELHRIHRVAVSTALACLLFSGLSVAQDPVLDKRFKALHLTPNWRFITPEFVERITERQSELRGTKVSIVGTLRNSDGRSIADAFVILRLVSNNSMVSHVPEPRDVFAVGWSDDKGIFRFQKQPTPWFEPSVSLPWQLLVFAPGSALEFRTYQFFDQHPHILKMDLSPERVIRGKTVDAEGVAVGGAAIAHYEIIEPYTSDIECSFLNSECLCSVHSDAEGNFVIGGLPADRTVSVSPLLEGSPLAWLGYQRKSVATSELDEAKVYPKDRSRSRLIHPYATSPFEMQSDKTRSEIVQLQARLAEKANAFAVQQVRPPNGTVRSRFARVRVVNAATGEGVSEVGIGISSATSSKEYLRSQPGMQATDEDGRALLKISRQSGSLIYAIGRRYGYITHYRRMTTSPDEYTPPIEQDEWLREVPAGDEDVDLIFEVTPVSPLKLTVTKEDGTPVVAKIEVWQHGWPKSYIAASEYTDADGQLELPLRPVIFAIDVKASTEDGLVGELEGLELSKTLTQADSAKIIVRR